jgi:hypothetical protein
MEDIIKDLQENKLPELRNKGGLENGNGRSQTVNA